MSHHDTGFVASWKALRATDPEVAEAVFHELDRERRAGVLEQRQFRLAHLKTHPDGIERHDRRQRLR